MAASYPFSDNLEGGLGNWTGSGLWGLTTVSSFSPTHSVADSPSAFYGNTLRRRSAERGGAA
jgi:hypothetical protein